MSCRNCENGGHPDFCGPACKPRPPAPSVLYSDHFKPPIFLAGELDSLLGETSAQLRALTLGWIGVLGELRPNERAKLEPIIQRMRAGLLEAWQCVDPLSEAMEAIGDERRRKAIEDAGEDEIAPDYHDHTVQNMARAAAVFALDFSGASKTLTDEQIREVVQRALDTAIADNEGG